MAVMLPPEVAHLLQLLGYEWPEGNEDRVIEMGREWLDFGSGVHAPSADAEMARAHVTSENRGAAVDAFNANFRHEDGAPAVLAELGQAAAMCGGALFVVAGAIVVLKVVVVAQLVMLAVSIAEAIAAAVPTAGASMSLIPLMKVATSIAINIAIGIAVETVMGGQG